MFLIYALFGVLCLGLAPLFGKTALNTVSPLTAFALRTIIAAALVLGWMVISKAFTELHNLPASFWVIITIEAVLAAILGDMAYFYALQNGSIHEVSVIMACAPLVTIILGHFVYNEIVSVHQLIGAVLITTGLVIISIE
ncbi:MAG: EamA family transporter [Veillonellaceae bacterium]|jgi:transporter family protein|nr:EamA family transporter [Veillonellaceae bacterium]